MDSTQAKAALDRLIAQGETPGLQYMFVSADAVLFSYSAGIANPAEGVPVSDRTTFNAYSVTKTFTAAAVLKLAEQGRLDLDQPIARYLDRFPYAQGPTVRQTLAHTGGFPNPNPMAWVHLADEHAAFDNKHFVDTVLHANGKLKSAPGKAYAYSNVGYLLLGEAIEKVSGRAYTAHVKQQLIQPLRLLKGETLAFTIEQPRPHPRGTVARWSLLNLVLGWFIDRERFVGSRSNRWVQLRNLHVNGAAYGGLIGNARGFSRYLQALLGRDDYLSAPSRALLFTPAMGPGGNELPRSVGVGLAFVPSHAVTTAGLSEARKHELLGRVSAAFAGRDFIRDIASVPDTYLRSRGGFQSVDQVARLYGLDVIALVSYDQVVHTEDTRASWTYSTIVGAFLVKGSKNDVQTFVDSAIFDVKTRALLFRAPGIDRVESTSTLINSPEETRKARERSFDSAMADMTQNLGKELESFRARIKADKSVTVTQQPGTARNGGGAAGLEFLGLLAAGLWAAWPRARADRARGARNTRCGGA